MRNRNIAEYQKPCTIHVALTGLEFSFPLAAPFFTGTGRELNSIGWCYNNAGQGLTPLFQEKGDFSWVLKPGFNSDIM